MNDSTTGSQPAPVGLLRRLGCMAYDGIMVLAVLLLVTLGVSIFGGITPEHPWYPAYVLLVGLSAFLYYGWFWTHGGISLPMQTWRVRLVSRSGGAVTWLQSLSRFTVALAQWVLVLWGIRLWNTGQVPMAAGVGAVVLAGLVWTVLHPQKLMLHDLLSGTRLIRLGPDRSGGI
ncbi:Uncharacterized membrane protein YckC, RDD family [Ectothiorhodospira mobilis]|uniref:Uncharacterized membrane protein YckC, RDD family n=1 Tax=Ectothiorhodospira mobilis TaxID=195064 RepID=A0A1I4Q6L6_ECTMO|nr:RDD family protein [Ectothiorhodospira mobilis]SFM35694.1 Uncharacterized membrane protein YckC, RDD family [Ectothiorhodospira mobilis]